MKKHLFDIDSNFDRVQHRIEAVSKRAYGNDVYLLDDKIKRDHKIKFNWNGAFLGFCILFFVLLFVAINMNCINYYTYCEPNEYDILWRSLFFPFEIEPMAFVMVPLYVFGFVTSFGYITARKWNTVTDTIKRLEITKNPNNTIVSFYVGGNMDYLFKKEMEKEFSKAVEKNKCG